MTRTRMFPAKANYKGSHTSLECRWCKEKNTVETQKHILSECEEIRRQTKTQIKYEDKYNDTDMIILRETSEKIMQIMEYIHKE